MADPVIQAVFDNVLTVLGAMGREAGSLRDYRGAIGLPVDGPLEPDLENPWVQVIIGGVDRKRDHGNEIAYDYHRHRQEFYVRVNVPPAMRILNGISIRDLTLPIWQVRSDIHTALMADRTRGVGGHVTTFYVQPEVPVYFGVDVDDTVEIGGVTVIERYGVEWAHLTGDMTTAA